MKYFVDNYDSIIFFDVETTGLDYRDDDVIEFACIIVSSSGAVKTHDWLVGINRRLPRFVVELTHITDEMLAEKGVKRAGLVRYLADNVFNSGKTLLVAHNANFDVNFVSSMFAKEGRRLNWSNIDMLDTLTVLKDRKEYPHKLENAIRHYGLEGAAVNSHRAIDDVKALLMVFEKMCEENKDIVKYINLFGFNPKYGIRASEKLPRIRYESQAYESNIKLYRYYE